MVLCYIPKEIRSFIHKKNSNLTYDCRFHKKKLLICICMIGAFSTEALAKKANTKNINSHNYSATLLGPLGLNTIPSARMSQAGTISAGISTLDPYLHGYLGIQLSKSIYVGLRQSAEISNLNSEAKRLYPGTDLKLQLWNESQYMPAISLGLQSATGHKRMSGEYISASKRYNNFDLTAGLGWGRYGTAGHFSNPLKAIHQHFGKDRLLDGEMPNEPTNWFTGKNVGVFAGVEYFTPIKGLSLKADYGADHYSAETRSINYKRPKPWSIGASYTPQRYPWLDTAIATQGFEKIMARISFKHSPSHWPFTTSQIPTTEKLRPFRNQTQNFAKILQNKNDKASRLSNIQAEQYKASALLHYKEGLSASSQLQRASILIANHADQNIERISIQPGFLSLRGPKVHLLRKDLERTLAYRQGSPSEIWRSTEFSIEPVSYSNARNTAEQEKEAKKSENKTTFFQQFKQKTLKLRLENQTSLSEEDSGTLTRNALIATINGPSHNGFIHTGSALRLNLYDNLDRLAKLRPRAILPVRSNVDLFADRLIALENAHTSLTYSITPEIHTLASVGYLEEMYGGAGGEILYRPFGKRFALGADMWLALKRDPLVSMNTGFNGDSLLTGHMNAWYDFPEDDLTAQIKLGRYLAEDIGGTFSLQKTFGNGAKIKGFATMTDQADFDLFGGTTHLYSGIQLSLPLGSIKYVPDNSDIQFTAAPFGRDIGQSIKRPIELYEATEMFSYDHLSRYWYEMGHLAKDQQK